MNRGMINIALQMRGEGHNQVSQTWDSFEILREAKKAIQVCPSSYSNLYPVGSTRRGSLHKWNNLC